MKKENVYVVVDTEKKAKKVKAVLDMFGYNHTPLCLKGYEKGSERVHFKQSSEKFYNDNGTMLVGKSKVSIKQLRNILAVEKLKEGDVVVVKNPNGKWLIEFCAFKDCGLINFLKSFSLTKDLCYGVTRQNGSIVDCNFIRYATEEEKALLEPKELTPQDYDDKTWYKSSSSGNMFYLDKSKYKHHGFRKDYCNDLEWFANFKENGFHIKGKWVEADEIEITELLFNESKQRGIVVGSIVDANGIRADIVGGFPVLSVHKDKFFYAGMTLFNNGKWAESVKVEKKYNHDEVKKAFEEGKEVEFLCALSLKWKDCKNPLWFDDLQYRVKPTQEIKRGSRVVVVNSGKSFSIHTMRKEYGVTDEYTPALPKGTKATVYNLVTVNKNTPSACIISDCGKQSLIGLDGLKLC